MNAIQTAARFGKSPVSAVMALAKQIEETKTGLDVVAKTEILKKFKRVDDVPMNLTNETYPHHQVPQSLC